MLLGLDPTYHSLNACRPAWLRRFASLASAVGADSIWVSEHMVVPMGASSKYPYTADGTPPFDDGWPFPDPIDWLSWMAAITEGITLCPGVLILPQHHPVQLAKRLATLDQLSEGRARVGVGVGWLREELDLFSVPFEQRGRVVDDYIGAMRALWADGPASYRSEFVSFHQLASEPKPVQSGGIPVVVGGSSLAAARRAGRLGDGYIPIGVDPDKLAVLLETMRSAAIDAGRDPAAIEITVRATFSLEEAQRFVDLGAHRFRLAVRSDIPFDEAASGVERFVADVLQNLAEPASIGIGGDIS
jgi:probable F420-dependent oxidoreductase